MRKHQMARRSAALRGPVRRAPGLSAQWSDQPLRRAVAAAADRGDGRDRADRRRLAAGRPTARSPSTSSSPGRAASWRASRRSTGACAPPPRPLRRPEQLQRPGGPCTGSQLGARGRRNRARAGRGIDPGCGRRGCRPPSAAGAGPGSDRRSDRARGSPRAEADGTAANAAADVSDRLVKALAQIEELESGSDPGAGAERPAGHSNWRSVRTSADQQVAELSQRADASETEAKRLRGDLEAARKDLAALRQSAQTAEANAADLRAELAEPPRPRRPPATAPGHRRGQAAGDRATSPSSRPRSPAPRPGSPS